MEKWVADIVAESISVKKEFFARNAESVVRCAETMAGRLEAGNKILLFGNGGSAADAQHIAAEFVNRFRIERRPLAAIALTTDTSVLTSIGNDYHFDEIFEKQVSAIGRSGDVAVGISTSGNSANVLRGIEMANRLQMITVGMGGKGGALAALAAIAFSVDSETTARIQETHITIGHVLCELVDRMMFPESFGE